MSNQIDWKSIVITGAIILVAAGLLVLVIWGLLRLNRFVFGKIQKKHKGLHLLFFQRVNAAIILIGGIILVLSMFSGFDSVWKTMLGGTAIISGVLAFAAQDIIKDILGGLMISLHKPFETGNRIELEDGTVGIVKDMTMRHVVLLGMDTQYYVIPNSKINLQKIRNYSYQMKYRSAHFNFYIGYGSDVQKAMDVIRETIIASPVTIPGKVTENGSEYADVYFMAYEQSSLRLSTTVYFESTTPSEVLISDVNCRVNLALHENGIEIPYPYVNVVQAELPAKLDAEQTS